MYYGILIAFKPACFQRTCLNKALLQYLSRSRSRIHTK